MQQNEQLRQIPVIVLTTHCGHREQVLTLGARACIEKPFVFEQFLMEV